MYDGSGAGGIRDHPGSNRQTLARYGAAVGIPVDMSCVVQYLLSATHGRPTCRERDEEAAKSLRSGVTPPLRETSVR